MGYLAQCVVVVVWPFNGEKGGKLHSAIVGSGIFI